ncbi:hypothetical protein GCM10028805_39120 [Spirosoma harenae]
MDVLAAGIRQIALSRLIGWIIGWSLIVLPCTLIETFAQESKVYSSDLQISISILYFDQSSHQLRPGVKASLDSLAQLLTAQPKLMAMVTGYTDNIGKRELNMTLAEQRAKTVANYLKQQGVSTDQIKANWVGPDQTTSVNARTISRRVIVQLLPK